MTFMFEIQVLSTFNYKCFKLFGKCVDIFVPLNLNPVGAKRRGAHAHKLFLRVFCIYVNNYIYCMKSFSRQYKYKLWSVRLMTPIGGESGLASN